MFITASSEKFGGVCCTNLFDSEAESSSSVIGIGFTGPLPISFSLQSAILNLFDVAETGLALPCNYISLSLKLAACFNTPYCSYFWIRDGDFKLSIVSLSTRLYALEVRAYECQTFTSSCASLSRSIKLLLLSIKFSIFEFKRILSSRSHATDASKFLTFSSFFKFW